MDTVDPVDINRGIAKASQEFICTVTANFTAEPIEECLRFWLHRLLFNRARVEFAGYNQVFQELTSPTSLLSSSTPGFNLVLIRLEDWARAQECSRRVETVVSVTHEFVATLLAFASKVRRPTIVLLCPPSGVVAEDKDFSAALQALHQECQVALKNVRGVTLVTPEEIAERYPVEVIEDLENDRQAHIPFSPEYWTALGSVAVRTARPLFQPPFKMVVVDADNTLWGGVVGEVGADQVRIDHGHKVLHSCLQNLKCQGLLLAIASKNEEADVASVFRRSDMVLQAGDFVAWKVNWESKSRNIMALARELELGLDSIAFLDDNPVECAEVGTNCPGVTPFLIPADSAELPSYLKHIWAFDITAKTALDENRTELYRQQSQRNQFRDAVGSFQEFINGLQLQVTIAPPSDSQMDRAAQLTQRTNQFNTSGIRRSSSELTAVLRSREKNALLVSARDRFGDYGEIGLAIYDFEGTQLRVETLLMSCRVLGKGVEHQFMSQIGQEAARLGATQVDIPFKPSERNRPAEQFLLSIGAGRDKNGTFHLPVHQAVSVRFQPETAPPDELVAEADELKSRASTRPDFAAIAGSLRSVKQIMKAIAGSLERSRPPIIADFVRACSPQEIALAKIWETVLHIREVGVRDGFLDLGGTSLQAASITSRIPAEFGVRLSIEAFFSNVTIIDLVARLPQAPSTERSLPKADQTMLSASQQRLWFLNQLITTRSAYNIPVARRIHGSLRIDALNKALSHLVARHELLRSSYSSEGGTAQLNISDGATPDFRHVQVDSESKALVMAGEEARRPFDLVQDSLLRCLVVSWSETNHILVLTAHHIVSDGWSSGLLLRDLNEAYEAAVLDHTPTWSYLPSYVDYAYWLTKRQLAGEFASDLEYWSRELRGAPSLLELPLDKSRPAVMRYQGESLVGYVPLATRRGLESFSSRVACTPFAVLLAAWQILLYRYSHQDDIVVGVPVAGRTHPLLENLVGCFVNTLAIRSQINGQTSFQRHVGSTRDKLVEALAHQELPFETLVGELGLERNLSRSPLFQTMLVLQDFQIGDFQPADLTVSAFPLHNGGAKFDLLMEVTPIAEGYQLVLEYNVDLFSPETAQRMLNHFLHLLNAGIAHPNTAVDDLTILSKNEWDEIIHGFNSSSDHTLPYNSSLHELIELQVARHPGAIALTFEGRSLTYGEVNARANQVAHYLKKLGVGRGMFVGVFVERSFEMVIGLLGILKAGGAYVPIDPEYPAERVAFMARDSSAQVLLVQHRLLAQLPTVDGKVVCLDTEWDRIDLESQSNPPNITTPEDLAYMIYTSGSTGLPKGAMNAHVGICNRLLWMQKQFQLNESDVVLQKTPFSFDVSVWEFFWPLLVGARLVIAKPGGHRDSAYLVDIISAERVTVMHFVPSMLGAFMTTPGLDRCDSLRHVMCSGEALPYNLVEEFVARFQAKLHNLYGPTEAAVDVTYWTCRPHDERNIVPIGRPVANTQIYILDRQLQPVPVGVSGELYIGGIQVGMGYHNRPELTEERFIPDHLGGRAGGRLYRTGDLSRFLPKGEIEYLGRTDHQVKIRGFRVELGEIEAALCRHPDVREAIVTPREDVPGMKRLVAYLVSGLNETDLDAIRDYLKTTLPEFMIPAAFVFMDRFPLSPNGKIDRKLLPTPMPRQNPARSYVAPRTGPELTLAEVWSKVLRVERVGIHDNFFELGGDSILSIQVISMARRSGWKITPPMFFANQTVAELAAAATPILEPKANEDVADGEVELTPIQEWFFEQRLEEIHHFNQAFLLEAVTPLDRVLVESTLKELLNRHDALRLRYHHDGRGWHQRYAVQDESQLLQWVDLTSLPARQQTQQLEEVVAATHVTLDLEHGPIWRVAYFKTDHLGTDRILFVIHHLAVDGVSWRILLEDFEHVYQQLQGGTTVQWPAKTTSYKGWAKRLQAVSKSESFLQEMPYWAAVTDSHIMRGVSESLVARPDENREADAKTLHTRLTAEETQALLKQIPPVYNTQVNDVLLTALARAWGRWSGSRLLLTDLEGHGREDVGGDLNTSRTVGWFTSIFPVKLECPEAGADWHPGSTLKAVKEQLRSIPQRGIGYGVLRYLAGETGLAEGLNAPMVFNYWGQLDQLLSGSRLFRFSSESSGPWHSPSQRRRYVLEVNVLVVNGRLEVRWTYPRSLKVVQDIELLAREYEVALRAIIAHCQLPTAGGRTPSDFPLSGLDQVSLDRLLADYSDAEDIYPLSPIQTLFYSAHQTNAGSLVDQWHCTLDGPLQVSTFQRAWQETIQRHSILRSSIHADGLREPRQIVHRTVQLPWTIEDWRETSLDKISGRWQAFLQQDLLTPIDLTQAPAMRFFLAQVGEQRWKFAWSVPALLLDGWSWPLVFRDVSHGYDALVQGEGNQLEPARPYRDYVAWLKQQSQDSALSFWQHALAGVEEPTPITPDANSHEERVGKRYIEQPVLLSAGLMAKLQATARRCHVTLNTLVQAGWAIQLSRQSGKDDIVFGASFSSRPTDLVGSEGIVGPFVNNVPIRVVVDASAKIGDFLRELHKSLLELNPYQFTPLADIQRVSQVPWRYRLFDSLVVFQNYLVDESARRLGKHVTLSEFSGPIHTNYPILLLAEPGAELRMMLVCDSRYFSRGMRERWAQDLARLFDCMPDMTERVLVELQSLLSDPPAIVPSSTFGEHRGTQHLISPQTKTEQTIAEVWGQLFGMERVSIDDNFFDLGGHSMLLIRMHARLREVLNLDFPIVTLLQHPSIRLLARCLDKPASDSAAEGDRLRDRAKKQKEAIDRSRSIARKR